MPKTDELSIHVTYPAGKAAAVTPNDGADLPTVARALYVGTAGNIAVLLADDTVSIVLKNVPAGSILPIRVKRVLATNTTAADLVALS